MSRERAAAAAVPMNSCPRTACLCVCVCVRTRTARAARERNRETYTDRGVFATADGRA